MFLAPTGPARQGILHVQARTHALGQHPPAPRESRGKARLAGQGHKTRAFAPPRRWTRHTQQGKQRQSRGWRVAGGGRRVAGGGRRAAGGRAPEKRRGTGSEGTKFQGPPNQPAPCCAALGEGGAACAWRTGARCAPPAPNHALSRCAGCGAPGTPEAAASPGSAAGKRPPSIAAAPLATAPYLGLRTRARTHTSQASPHRVAPSARAPSHTTAIAPPRSRMRDPASARIRYCGTLTRRKGAACEGEGEGGRRTGKEEGRRGNPLESSRRARCLWITSSSSLLLLHAACLSGLYPESKTASESKSTAAILGSLPHPRFRACPPHPAPHAPERNATTHKTMQVRQAHVWLHLPQVP